MTPREGLKCNDSLKWLTVNNENTVNLSSFCIKLDVSSTLAQAEPFRSRVGPAGVWGVVLWSLMERWVRMGGGEEEGYWSLEAANGSRSWPSYMCCGVGADVGWLLLVDDRPQ